MSHSAHISAVPRNGFPPFPAAWVRGGDRGVDTGVYCFQFEASLHPQRVNNQKSASHYQVWSERNGT